MNRIFVKQGLSLLGIMALLLAGLAGCGGDEPAPVARPPAPPPAPAFQPEAVEVALGESGDMITLMTTEAGGFTRDGEAFETGAEVTAENGNVYTLTLADGAWAAAYNVMEVEVMLGASGSTVTVVTAEDGTYWVGEDELMDGGMLPAENGNVYTLTLVDGAWMTAYQAMEVNVALGASGTSVTVVTAEDGTYWVGEDELMDGGMRMADNGNSYTLTLVDGEWMTAFNAPDEVMVTLGTSGTSVTIETAEDGTYWLAGELFESGDDVDAANGNKYVLTQVAGEWSAEFQPASMPIAGISLMAMSQQDGDGYDVGDQTLDEDGSGDIMTDDGNFHVSMDDMGMFMATQYDAVVDGGDNGTTVGDDMDLAVIADDEETDVNEAGTMLTVNGDSHPIETLFSAGTSTVEGDNLVAGVKDEVVKLAAQIKGLIAVNETEPEDGRTDFSDQFRAKWKAIDTQLDAIFGDQDSAADDDTVYDHLDELATGTLSDALVEKMVETLDMIVAALSSKAGFEAAVVEDGDGVFEGFGIDEADDAAKAFDARASSASVYLGRTANTRFGLYTKTVRTVASVDLAAPDTGASGVFAYSPMGPAKLADLPSSGGAFYAGDTMALDGTGEKIYNGDIALQVRFRSKRVSGLVSNLKDADGNGFAYGFGTVDTIILEQAVLGEDGDFAAPDDTMAQIVYAAVPGSPKAEPVANTFTGQFVGAGVAAIGTWSIGDDTDDEDLKGAFGAEQGDPVSDPAPETDDGGAAATMLNASVDDKGVLTIQAADDEATPPVVAITAKGEELYADGGGKITGANFVQDAREAIEELVDRLDLFISLEALDDKESANTGRESVWDKVGEQLDTIFGANSAANILTDGVSGGDIDYPRDKADDTVLDDDAAKEEINLILAALETEAAFTEAAKKGGILYHDDDANDDEDVNALLNEQKEADIFARVSHTVTIEYGNTDYTRFGAWNRTASANAIMEPTAPVTGANGLFAYSPLSQTKYSDDDPNFPAGGEATYEGSTIARDDGADAVAYYEGDIALVVTWTTLGTGVGNVGTLAAVVSDLRNSDGALYKNGDNDVDSVIFTSDDINVARDSAGLLSFNRENGDARLRHSTLSIPDTTFNGDADINGMFVGKSIDGPLGVLGSWSLDATGHDITGTYGADLAP